MHMFDLDLQARVVLFGDVFAVVAGLLGQLLQ